MVGSITRLSNSTKGKGFDREMNKSVIYTNRATRCFLNEVGSEAIIVGEDVER
uniref:Uncharacterized protein n=1 Tax=Lepeophtheirus salmonis TaxID=72036 RepID=A0A0K2VKN1_LEPSM